MIRPISAREARAPQKTEECLKNNLRITAWPFGPGGADSVLDDASGRITATEGRRTQGRLRLQQPGVLRVVQADRPDAGGHDAQAGVRGRPALSQRQRMRVQLLQRPKHPQRLEAGRGQAFEASALTRTSHRAALRPYRHFARVTPSLCHLAI
jgi:hypothetical protein